MTPERWRLLLATLRRLGLVPMVLRAVVLASAVAAIVATAAPGWDVPDGYLVIAAIAALFATGAPDSGAWVFVAAAIVAGWGTGTPQPAVGPAVVVTALALLVGHVASALAAAMPVTARADRRLVVRWWRPTAGLAAATVAAAAVVAVLEAWGPPGSIVLVLAALGVLGVAVWWWAAGGEDAA